MKELRLSEEEIIGLLTDVLKLLDSLRYAIDWVLPVAYQKVALDSKDIGERIRKLYKNSEAIGNILSDVINNLEKFYGYSERDSDFKNLKIFYQALLDIRRPDGIKAIDLVWLARRLGRWDIKDSAIYRLIVIIMAKLKEPIMG